LPKFPKREADILALANAMEAGYIAHLADFPSNEWALLKIKRLLYTNASNAQTEALAAAQVATDDKNLKLADLEEKMRDELKKSEVDVGSDSEKLEYISPAISMRPFRVLVPSCWTGKLPPAAQAAASEPMSSNAATSPPAAANSASGHR
jgi:hypothetical protein